MTNEKKTCQNCKQEFTIEPDDFAFYKKMRVPAPTFCPACRFQRRMMFRNERVFYKRTCDLCGESMISIFASEKPYTVYCQPCWWSDKWDPMVYAMDYNPSKGFFEQYQELQLKTPFMSLINGYATIVGSDYINHAGYAKNCYLIFNSDNCENTYYGTTVNRDKDCMDALILDESELCYQVINGSKCYRTFFSEDCTSCTDVYFSKNLVGCSHCFGCINLRNKSYHIFNKPYTKEVYEREVKKYDLSSFSLVEQVKKQVREFWTTFPHKFIHGLRNTNVSGDYVYESKNAHNMYQVRYVEDGRFCQFITLPIAKDLYDLTEWGNGAERVYDSITVGEGTADIKFCFGAWDHNLDSEYSMFVVNCSHVFGCLNLRKKQYCILNKQYTKEEYKKLRVEIIRSMNENPYTDSKGRIFTYGEFFPYDVSVFDYNESTAIQYYPLSKEQVLENRWRWHDANPGEYTVTVLPNVMPDNINDVDETILQEVLGCFRCRKAFRIVKGEYDLLKRFNFPLPRQCPDCRHMERISRINPPRLWERTCAKCGTEMQTSYAPHRKEAVYCEQCYQAEVI